MSILLGHPYSAYVIASDPFVYAPGISLQYMTRGPHGRVVIELSWESEGSGLNPSTSRQPLTPGCL